MSRTELLFSMPLPVLVLAGCLAAYQTTAGQAVVVDAFDVGAATEGDDPDDPLDVAWSNGSVVDDSGGIGSGNALDHTGGNGDTYGTFEPFDLPGMGQFVELSWDFRIVNDPIPAAGNADSGNFPYRVYLSPAPERSMGYGIRIGTGGDGVAGNDGNGIGLRDGNFRAGPYNTPDGDVFDGPGTQNSTFTINDNEMHSASLTIRRDMVETEINGVPTGLVEGVRLEGLVDNVMISGVVPFGFEHELGFTPTTTFNYVYVDSNNGIDAYLDNVRVETGFVGPPPTPGDVDGDDDVDLDDLTVIRNNFLETGHSRDEGDLSGDSLVGFQDFREWKDNSAGGLGATTAVPEPTGGVLLIFGAAGVLSCLLQRRRQR